MRRLIVPVFAIALGAACAPDVSKDKTEAVVAEPAAPVAEPVVEAAPPVAPTGVIIPIDTARSELKALGAKVTATHPIVFKVWAGSVMVDGDTLTDLTFEAEMASLESDAPKLTEHLKTPDFFDVATFPKATFAASSITAAPGEGGTTHSVTGDLTLRGVTKTVTFPAKITVAPDAITGATEFVLNRQDFGITYPGKADDLVQDKVVLTVSFVAPRG